MNQEQKQELDQLAARVAESTGIKKWKGTSYLGQNEPLIMLDTSFLFPDRVGLGPHKEAYKTWTDGIRAFNEKHNLPTSQKNTIYQYDYDHSGGHVDIEGTNLIIHGSTLADLKKVVSIIESDAQTFQNIVRETVAALPKEVPKTGWRSPPTIITGEKLTTGKTAEPPSSGFGIGTSGNSGE